jgi:hypothetical protein
MKTLDHNTRTAVDFLVKRPGFPVLSCAWIDPQTGKKGSFETKSFPPPVDRKRITEWIEARQGKGNIYYSVNPALRAQDKKLERENIKGLVSLHVDLDPRAGEDQEAAQVRIVRQLDTLKLPPTWIINSGGGVQGIWDLIEEVPIGGNLEIAEDLKCTTYSWSASWAAIIVTTSIASCAFLGRSTCQMNVSARRGVVRHWPSW